MNEMFVGRVIGGGHVQKRSQLSKRTQAQTLVFKPTLWSALSSSITMWNDFSSPKTKVYIKIYRWFTYVGNFDVSGAEILITFAGKNTTWLVTQNLHMYVVGDEDVSVE